VSCVCVCVCVCVCMCVQNTASLQPLSIVVFFFLSRSFLSMVAPPTQKQS
jgi:hypothetical protein